MDFWLLGAESQYENYKHYADTWECCLLFVSFVILDFFHSTYVLSIQDIHISLHLFKVNVKGKKS